MRSLAAVIFCLAASCGDPSLTGGLATLGADVGVGPDAAHDPGPADPAEVDLAPEPSPPDGLCPPDLGATILSSAPVAQISVGARGACARRTDGMVACWGSGDAGELGDGRAEARALPVTPWLLRDVVEVDAGASTHANHFCARKADGTVWCWGAGESGQLGSGVAANATVPVQVVGLKDATSISAGGRHSCAVTAEGSVWCWGLGAPDALGLSDAPVQPTPAVVEELPPMRQVAAGSPQTCAVSLEGQVYCWGRVDVDFDGNTYLPLDRREALARPALIPVSGVQKVAVGRWHDAKDPDTSFACALLEDGEVQCWGSGVEGSLGDGQSSDSNLPVDLALPEPAVDLDAGAFAACAISASRRVYCWGWQFGPLPVALDGVDDALQVSVGTAVCALSASRGPLCIGLNQHGQLGAGGAGHYEAPNDVVDLDGVAELAVSYDSTCARRTDGQVHCWGRRPHPPGQPSPGGLERPTPVEGLPALASLAGAGYGTPPHQFWLPRFCGLDEAGAAYCWGGAEGETPETLEQPALSGLAIALTHGCGVHPGGQVTCWEEPDDGFTAGAMVPFVAPSATFGEPVESVAMGHAHQCALLASGAVACWGQQGGKLVGGGADGSEPVLVEGITAATALAARLTRTCALQEGQVWCWGMWQGEVLGPTLVGGLEGPVSALDVGVSQSCAVLESGGVQCWRHGGDNPLGAPEFEAPRVPDLEGVVQVVVGHLHACALRSEGTVACWGSNSVGQIGDGLYPRSSVWQRVRLDLAAPGVAPCFGAERVALQPPPQGTIATGGDITVRVTPDGEVLAWGRLSDPQGNVFQVELARAPVGQPLATTAVDAVAAPSRICALLADGRVQCWGSLGLGDGYQPEDWGEAFREPGPTVPWLQDAVAISTSDAHTCAVRATGELACWPGPEGHPTPVAVPGVRDAVDVEVVALGDEGQESSVCVLSTAGEARCWPLWSGEAPVSLAEWAPSHDKGASHGCALTAAGTPTCQGDHTSGQLGTGIGPDEPAGVAVVWPLSVPPEQLAAGSESSGAVVDGQAYLWGRFGEIDPPWSRPTLVDAGFEVRRLVLSQGSFSVLGGGACLVGTAGQLACLGGNPDGGLGFAAESSDAPVQVQLPGPVREVAMGGRHTCALLESGEVLCWGRNDEGQLGHQGPGGPEPVAVEGLGEVVQLALGGHHTCALHPEGSVSCWGYDSHGQLNLGGVGDAVAIAAQYSGTCVLHAAGTVTCVGANALGALGDGSGEDRHGPVTVAGVEGATELASGWQTHGHTCARTRGGLMCWGARVPKVDGESQGNPSLGPVPFGPPEVEAFAVGGRHICLLHGAGAPTCYGGNGAGQLGEGSYPFASAPVEPLLPD